MSCLKVAQDPPNVLLRYAQIDRGPTKSFKAAQKLPVNRPNMLQHLKSFSRKRLSASTREHKNKRTHKPIADVLRLNPWTTNGYPQTSYTCHETALLFPQRPDSGLRSLNLTVLRCHKIIQLSLLASAYLHTLRGLACVSLSLSDGQRFHVAPQCGHLCLSLNQDSPSSCERSEVTLPG